MPDKRTNKHRTLLQLCGNLVRVTLRRGQPEGVQASDMNIACEKQQARQDGATRCASAVGTYVERTTPRKIGANRNWSSTSFFICTCMLAAASRLRRQEWRAAGALARRHRRKRAQSFRRTATTAPVPVMKPESDEYLRGKSRFFSEHCPGRETGSTAHAKYWHTPIVEHRSNQDAAERSEDGGTAEVEGPVLEEELCAQGQQADKR